MVDRTTKFLLVLIAVALWGFLLRPLLSVPKARAGDTAAVAGSNDTSDRDIQVASSDGILYVVRDRHFISAYKVGKPGEDASKTINFIDLSLVH